MKFKVYHQRVPIFFAPSPHPSKLEDCDHVANVEVNSIDEVFRVTNHIDSEWFKNPEVTWHRSNNERSTSVGDIVVDENGKAFHCDMAGWGEIK